MKALIAGVLARRYLLIVIAVIATPLFPFVTTALLALETARRGTLEGSLSAVAGIAGVAVIAWVLGDAMPMLVAFGAVSMLAGVGMGALLRWSGALGLAFQVTVSGCLIAAVAVTWFGPEPSVFLDPLIQQLVDAFRESGASEAELEAIAAGGAMLFSVIVAAVLLQVIGGLLLGYWWLTLVREATGFGVEFRALKLGRVLGLTAMVLLALGLIPGLTAIQNLSPLVVFCFLFQGLAVLHAWAHAKQWNPFVTGAAYVLLIPPFTLLGVLGLSTAGLVDNIFDLRAPLRARP
ncbi:DUF2232 domain-containing protein [Candidatus Rariloculus sp.]|uniref:DUF2232 domain-containing protein n=1 Tax=Candidatus Rariloculus sp. TaxID=3101265 RepID=UPI003D0B1965